MRRRLAECCVGALGRVPVVRHEALGLAELRVRLLGTPGLRRRDAVSVVPLRRAPAQARFVLHPCVAHLHGRVADGPGAEAHVVQHLLGRGRRVDGGQRGDAALPVLGNGRRSRRGCRARLRVRRRLVERTRREFPRLPDVALGELALALLGQLGRPGTTDSAHDGEHAKSRHPATHGQFLLPPVIGRGRKGIEERSEHGKGMPQRLASAIRRSSCG